MAVAPAPDISDEDRVEWSEEEYLSHEKDLLGFYVTGHPLDKYRATITAGKYVNISDIQSMKAFQTVQGHYQLFLFVKGMSY